MNKKLAENTKDFYHIHKRVAGLPFPWMTDRNSRSSRLRTNFSVFGLRGNKILRLSNKL